MITTPAAAYVAARSALRDAPTFTDRDLSTQGTIRRRAELIRAANAQLLAAAPVLIDGTTTRDDVLASRAPKTADEVAVHSRERQKASELSAAGKSIEEIVAGASELRAAALADDLESLAARDAEEAERVAQLLFDRLVVIGAPDAVALAAAEREGAVARAWHAALTATAEGRDPDLETRTTLYAVDREGYDLALANDVAVDWPAVARIEATHPAE